MLIVGSARCTCSVGELASLKAVVEVWACLQCMVTCLSRAKGLINFRGSKGHVSTQQIKEVHYWTRSTSAVRAFWKSASTGPRGESPRLNACRHVAYRVFYIVYGPDIVFNRVYGPYRVLCLHLVYIVYVVYLHLLYILWSTLAGNHRQYQPMITASM